MKHIICALLVLGVISSLTAQDKNAKSYFDPVFVHTVYFWFKEDTTKKDKVFFEHSLKKFLSNSKYAKTKFVGTPPEASREVVDDSFTYSLIVTFESAEAQAGYQSEDAHLLFIEECQHLWDKVIVYDSNEVD